MGESPISLLFGKRIATNRLSIADIGNPNVNINEVILDPYGNQLVSHFAMSSYPGIPNTIMNDFPVPLASPDFIVPTDASGAYFF